MKEKYHDMLCNWASMLWEDEEILSELIKNPKKEVFLFKLDQVPFEDFLPKKRQDSITLNNVKWTLMHDGAFKAMNMGAASAEAKFTDTIYWDIHYYSPDFLCFQEGIMPPDFSAKEAQIRMLHHAGYTPHAYSSFANTLPIQMSHYRLRYGKKTEPLHLYEEAIIKGPPIAYGLQEGNKIEYHLNPEHLLDRYTPQKSFYMFVWDKNSYDVERLIHRDEFFEFSNQNVDYIYDVDPEIIRYLAEEKNFAWAAQYLLKKQEAFDLLFHDKNPSEGNAKRIHLAEQMKQNVLFLQECLEQRWNEILEEMGIVPEQNNDFSFPVWQWTFFQKRFFQPRRFHQGWLGYIPEFQDLFNKQGRFVLYFPASVQNQENLQEFLKDFYLKFSKVLMKKDFVDFGFRLTPENNH